MKSPIISPRSFTRASVINSFQNASGFFETAPYEKCGFQPWHATGYATSALLLIDELPNLRNSLYDTIVNSMNESDWGQIFTPLVLPDGSAGCDDVHGCAHKLVAIPAVVMMEQNMTYGSKVGGTHRLSDEATTTPTPTEKFLDWWFEFIEAHIDNTTGEVCPPAAHAKVVDCLGAGMAFHSLYTAAHRPWPHVSTVLDFALSLQDPDTHLWTSTISNWLNLDGAYQSTRSSEALKGQRQHDVQVACDSFLGAAAETLNNVTKMTAWDSPFVLQSHALPGVLTAVAECGRVFPHLVHTERAWRVSTDKGPYP